MSSAWLCFFFSSRRRHTRFDCDWSSDVCSSDLSVPPARPDHHAGGTEREHLLDVELAKQPAADLHSDLSHLQHRGEELLVVGTTIRAVHVDEVYPACTRARELGQRGERLGHGAMGAHHAPAFDINGGIELHGTWCCERRLCRRGPAPPPNPALVPWARVHVLASRRAGRVRP